MTEIYTDGSCLTNPGNGGWAAIINDGGKSSAIHLNALIYSNDLNLLDELFGEGKQSRIDTSTTKLKKFNHEFIPIKSINKDNTDFLFSFRAKLKGKGFSCDPNEDLEIISHLKKIYLKKIILNFLNKIKKIQCQKF